MFQMLLDILTLKKLFVAYLKSTFKWVSCILFGNRTRKSHEKKNSLGAQKRECLSDSQEVDAEAELGGQRLGHRKVCERKREKAGWMESYQTAISPWPSLHQYNQGLWQRNTLLGSPGWEERIRFLCHWAAESPPNSTQSSFLLGQALMLEILSLCHHCTTRENWLDSLPFLNTMLSLKIIIEKCLPKTG